MRGYFLSFSLYADKLEIKDMETKSSIHVKPCRVTSSGAHNRGIAGYICTIPASPESTSCPNSLPTTSSG